jgi:hypothetical protein
MADSIDGYKPPAPSLGHGVERSVPAQQAQPGSRGFDGGSYFETPSATAAHPGRSMLNPPPTTGPRSSPADVLAQTLAAFRHLYGGSSA